MECPICMEDLTNPYTTRCCNQQLHRQCFDASTTVNSMCPFCRTLQPQRNMKHIFDTVFGLTCLGVTIYIIVLYN
jgi:hypothetical protein